jgi:AraC-like DNA-binding protein
MWKFFEPELRRRLDQLDREALTSDRVLAALIELLPTGTSEMSDVARSLAMSTRTLQRRLREEGTSYQAALNATRESLAHHYLHNEGISVGQISFLLGYVPLARTSSTRSLYDRRSVQSVRRCPLPGSGGVSRKRISSPTV